MQSLLWALLAAEKRGGLPGGSVFLESGGHLCRVFCRRLPLLKKRRAYLVEAYFSSLEAICAESVVGAHLGGSGSRFLHEAYFLNAYAEYGHRGRPSVQSLLWAFPAAEK